MAGFPMRRALEKKIEELGGIEFVTAHISQGMTIGRLAEFIECSRPMLSFWINHTDERRDAVLAARKLKAEKLAEEALDIADQADETSNSGVNKARLQVDTRKWMASKLDPENTDNLQSIAPMRQTMQKPHNLCKRESFAFRSKWALTNQAKLVGTH